MREKLKEGGRALGCMEDLGEKEEEEKSIEFREINVGASNSLVFRQNIDDIAFMCFSPLDLMKIQLKKVLIFVKLYQV